MLTIADIPDEYRKGQTDGKNIARLASGVQQSLDRSMGAAGSAAGLRLVQAGFLFRSSEIGRVMNGSAHGLGDALREDPQLVDFAGGALASTTLAGAVDLSAAALYRMYFGAVDPSNPEREADVHQFPRKDELPEPARKWLDETQSPHDWTVLKGVRDAFVHRWFPIHITIGPAYMQQVEIEGERRSISDFLDGSRAFVIDRVVAAGLVMDAHARELGSTA